MSVPEAVEQLAPELIREIAIHHAKKARALFAAADAKEAQTGAQRDLVQPCLSCGEDFMLTASTCAWFHDRGLRLPRRCQPCRQARKVQQQEHSQ